MYVCMVCMDRRGLGGTGDRGHSSFHSSSGKSMAFGVRLSVVPASAQVGSQRIQPAADADPVGLGDGHNGSCR